MRIGNLNELAGRANEQMDDKTIGNEKSQWLKTCSKARERSDIQKGDFLRWHKTPSGEQPPF